jgi:hypothetical protein
MGIDMQERKETKGNERHFTNTSPQVFASKIRE